jgi:hypothetical protein
MPRKPLSSLSPHPLPEATVAVLRRLAAQAGIIFAGQVIRIDREDGHGYVDVVFRVDQRVRMPSLSNQYVLREWAGLWAGEAARYRIGQRLLMFATQPGASGLSSPVGGIAGAIPLVATRQPPLLHGGDAAPAYTAAEASQEEAVDLRWVDALALRSIVPQGYHPEDRSAARPARFAAVQPLPQNPTSPSLSTVLALLQPDAPGSER